MKPFNASSVNILIDKDSINDLDRLVNYYYDKSDRFNVIINLPSYTKQQLEFILNSITNSPLKASCCNFCIQVKDHEFTKDELNTLVEFDETLFNQASCTLFFKEMNVLWDITDFSSTYNHIFNLSDKVKNASPLEQLLFFYKENTNKIYNQEQSLSQSILSRSVIGVNATDKIVCSGYAMNLAALCNSLNNPNLKCYTMSVNLYKKDSSDYIAGHCLNVVYINDPKYSLKGYYVVDSCWDSIKKSGNNMTLSYFLIPFKDLNTYSTYDVKPLYNNPFIYFIDNYKAELLDNSANVSTCRILANQGIVDLKQEREIYRRKVLKKQIESNASLDKIAKLQLALQGEDSFAGKFQEYIFLKTVCAKIKAKTPFLTYKNLSDALLTMAIECEGMDLKDAKSYANDVLENSKKTSLAYFKDGAQNNLVVYAKTEQKERAEKAARLRMEYRERRQRIQERRAQMQKAKDSGIEQ